MYSVAASIRKVSACFSTSRSSAAESRVSSWASSSDRKWRGEGEESSHCSFCSTTISMACSSARLQLQSVATTSLYRDRGRGSLSLEARLRQAEARSCSCEGGRLIWASTVSR